MATVATGTTAPSGAGDTPTGGRRRRALAAALRRVDWRRAGLMALGLALFFGLYLCPLLPDPLDTQGQRYPIGREGQAAIGLFLLAALWWVFEVVPIGVTAIAVGVLQALCHLRDARAAFTDFFDPSVWFILGSIVVGMVFSRTGLTQRLAYRMVLLAGERTGRIYLGVPATLAP